MANLHKVAEQSTATELKYRPSSVSVVQGKWIIVPWGFGVLMPACHRYTQEGGLVHQGKVVLEEDSCH